MLENNMCGHWTAPKNIVAEAYRANLPHQDGSRECHPVAAPEGLDATLGERGKRYGEFKDQAVYAQGLAAVAVTSPNWLPMAPDQREALSVIFNKIGRILNGDPDYSDSWHDIAGYATLVDKRLKSEGK
jgi:hypothetical protein